MKDLQGFAVLKAVRSHGVLEHGSEQIKLCFQEMDPATV